MSKAQNEWNKREWTERETTLSSNVVGGKRRWAIGGGQAAERGAGRQAAAVYLLVCSRTRLREKRVWSVQIVVRENYEWWKTTSKPLCLFGYGRLYLAV